MGKKVKKEKSGEDEKDYNDHTLNEWHTSREKYPLQCESVQFYKAEEKDWNRKILNKIKTLF